MLAAAVKVAPSTTAVTMPGVVVVVAAHRASTATRLCSAWQPAVVAVVVPGQAIRPVAAEPTVVLVVPVVARLVLPVQACLQITGVAVLVVRRQPAVRQVQPRQAPTPDQTAHHSTVVTVVTAGTGPAPTEVARLVVPPQTVIPVVMVVLPT